MDEIQYVNDQMKHFDRLIGDIDCISATTESEILGAIRLELISAYRAGRESILERSQDAI